MHAGSGPIYGDSTAVFGVRRSDRWAGKEGAHPPVGLLAASIRYAMSGTDLASCCALQCHAMSGTDIVYAATTTRLDGVVCRLGLVGGHSITGTILPIVLRILPVRTRY
eukprot:3941566-Rhodomonas_salina.3